MSLAVMALCAIALLFLTMSGQAAVWSIFAVLVCFGTARAFYNPAQQALLPNLVSVKNLAGGIAISSFVLKTATVLGPVAGGLLYSISAPAPFAGTIGLLVGGAMAAFFIPPSAKAAVEPTWSHLLGGFRYVWSDKLILGALSLDMFAVLLGGATALMPVYARDILQVGPFGLGVLNASPAVGAIVLGIYMSIRPIRNRAGLVMLLSVAVFGIATIVFGLSRSFELSVAALIVMGAGDMVSVNLRQMLVQLWTPDHLRGRVSAINTVFIGASNEIGEFRAGVSAALIGTISAVVVGGLGTLAVVGLWTRVFPELLSVKKLSAERIPAPD
jgi:MFS family permease